MPSAVDTNVLLRFLVDDGSEHAEAARRIFTNEQVFLPSSVLLEAEWVLRSNFGFQREQTCDAFDRIMGLDTVSVQDVQAVENAVDACRAGMDFADALHMNSANNCEVFYTFDKRLIRKAAQEIPSILAREP